jgi:hypothetical protein
VEALLRLCAERFAAISNITDDQRAEIYDRARNELEAKEHPALQFHMRFRACS